MADYQESFNIIEPYREVWVCVPELVNKTIILDVLWFFSACKSLTLDTLFSAQNEWPGNWKKQTMKPLPTHISIQLWVRTTTSKHKKKPTKFQLSNCQPPQNPSHPIACWEIDHQHGNALQSVSVDPNVPPWLGCGCATPLLGLVVTLLELCFFQNIGVVFPQTTLQKAFRIFLSLDPPKTKNSGTQTQLWNWEEGGSINTWIMMMDQLLFYLPASNKLKTLADDSSNQIPRCLGNVRKSLGMMFIILTPPGAYKLTQSVETV